MTKAKSYKSTPASTAMRCAIYTRKSTDEGLDQEFNSLDAQRESGEAYIASQRGAGWECLPDHYDDGGFTGGNMDRPALRRLMADIEAGKVDCVVVYKVDRLSRSLLDFARMMETFEKHHVSFVSVTQQFNTSTSMGRLVLNVLLSFAQFEREIISERTRDKIAAARRKGKWSGGMPLLGYDVDPRGSKLIVNEDEAARVRAIFELYLERQSIMATIEELDRRGWVNKRWTTRKGHERGGKPFTKSSLYKLLSNVTYGGKLRYKDEIHQGEHAAIVSTDLWQRVQVLLGRNGRTGGAAVRNKFGAMLKGILRCVPCDCAMTPSHSTKNGTTRYWESFYTLACQRRIQPGWYCVDVGANYGYYATLFAKLVGRHGRVMALEPNPGVVELLEQTLRLNNVECPLEILPIAASHEPGKMQFWTAADNVSNASFFRHIAAHDSAAIEVRTDTLDCLLAPWHKVDLVKIDAEGAEEWIWEGMQETVARGARVMMEVQMSRYQDPAAFWRKIKQRFPLPCYIDYDGLVKPVPEYQLFEGDRHDWMLWLEP